MSLYIRLLAVFLCLLLTACSAPNAPTLRIGTNLWPGYEPLYLARELGYFEEDEIRLVEYTSTSQVLKAYRNGLLDAAAVTLDEAISLLSEGENIRIVLVMDVSNGADALIGQSSVKTIVDLKGKRIGFEHTALGAYFLSRIIELNALEKTDLTLVGLEVQQHVRAFKEKQVDAVITFDPARSELISYGGNVLFDSSQMPGEIVDVLVVRAEKLSMFEKNIGDIKLGWFKAINHIQITPDKYASVIDKRMRMGEDKVMTAFQGLDFPDKEKNEELLSAVAETGLIYSSRKMAKVMADTGVINSAVDTNILFEDKE